MKFSSRTQCKVHVCKAKQARKVLSDKIVDENWKILVEILKKKNRQVPAGFEKNPGWVQDFFKWEEAGIGTTWVLKSPSGRDGYPGIKIPDPTT